MIGLAICAVTAAMLLVRLGWENAAPLAWAGWGVGAAGLVALGMLAGAWGVAVGTVAGSVTALGLVLHAAWSSPVRRRRPPRERPSTTIPRRPADLARRIAVFMLTVPVAFVAAQWLAFGTQALARRGGWVDADTIGLTLFLQPVAWSILMTVQLTRSGPLRMIEPPAVATLAGTLLWAMS